MTTDPEAAVDAAYQQMLDTPAAWNCSTLESLEHFRQMILLQFDLPTETCCWTEEDE